MNGHADTLLASLNSLRSDNLACDFLICIKDATFHVHKLVLIAFSDYFRAMLLHDTKEAQEGKVDMKGVKSDAMKECIEYMYTGKCSVDTDTLEDLLQTGDILQLDGVKTICFMHMASYINADNCAFFLGLLEVFKNEPLTLKVKEFFETHFSEVGGSDDFKELRWQVVSKYLYEFSTDDRETWRVGIEWIKHEASTRDKHIYELVKILRMVEYPKVELLSSMWDETLFTSHSDCVDYIHRRLFADGIDLQQSLKLKNCVFLSVLAHQYKRSSQALIEPIIQFMKINLGKIMVLADFRLLHKDDFKTLISANDTNYLSEATKWNALVTWIEYNDDNRDIFTQLFKSIDLNSISNRFLNESIVNHPIFKNSNCYSDLTRRLVTRKEPIDDSIAAILAGKLIKFNISLGVAQIFSLPSQSTDGLTLVSVSNKVCLFSQRSLFYLNGTQWMKLSSLPYIQPPHEITRIVELHDCVFVVTGAKLYKYMPSEHSWTTHGGCDFEEFTATTSPNYIYVMSSGTIKKFDPITCEWTAFCQHPDQNMEYIIYTGNTLHVTNSNNSWSSFSLIDQTWSSVSQSFRFQLQSHIGAESYKNIVTIANRAKAFAIEKSSVNGMTLNILDVSSNTISRKTFTASDLPSSSSWDNNRITAACAFSSKKSVSDLHILSKRRKIII